VGVGFLGTVLTSLCAAAGAYVIAVGRRPFALDLARHYGADETILMDDHARVLERVKAITDGAGCDRVIEAAGAQWPLDLATELTRERGRLIIAGYHQDGPRQVNMQLWNWRGLDVINAHERDPAIYVQGMREAANAVASGALDPTPLYTHRVSLGRIGEAFEAMQRRDGNFMKALVMP
jgi:threonine dehydrogenase-like Zn-dependent dehydrogenase